MSRQGSEGAGGFARPSRAGRRALMLWLACLLGGVPPASAAADWRQERWVVESFTDVLSGGPGSGPVAQAAGGIGAICGGGGGPLFVIGNQFVDIVTTDGIRRHLAGTGSLGMRDGPAHRAQFRIGQKAHYGAYNIACGPRGDVFVADSGNQRVRRIYQADGQWLVSTWAGGGRRTLQVGESAPASTVAFGGTMAVAVTPNGELTVATNLGYYRVSADGTTVTYVDRWPASVARGERHPRLNVPMGGADAQGNVYFVSRTPDVVIRIDPAGRATHLAGVLFEGGRKPHERGDGPPREAYFDTPSSLVVSRDGSALYVGGGDEYNIRRIPVDGGNTATLAQDGRWHLAKVHPNASRGAAVVRPGARGELKPDGELTLLMVGAVIGGDRDGNLYAVLKHWSGRTQYIEGSGLLGTRVFRLRPTVDPG